MRLLHTADWHLGRSLHGASFQAEQEHVLGVQFLEIVKDTRPDAVLIAGDVFDRAVPPTASVELLDDILRRLILGLRVPVVMIPGNHDDAQRLSFCAALLRDAGLHIADSAIGDPVRLADAHGEVWILPSGYASPLLLAELFGEEDEPPRCHDTGFAVICRRLRALCPDGARMVAVAHAFLQDGLESDSERLLQVGGARPVACARFDGFHYVALGHLHRPQDLGGGRLRYSGSPLAYSFSEAGQTKSVTLVEMDAAGTVRTMALPLTPRRPLRVMSGTLAEVLAAEDAATREDWLQVVLTDAEPVWNALGRLRDAYPNLLDLRFARNEQAPLPGGPAPARAATDPLEALSAFYLEMRHRPLPDLARNIARTEIDAARAEA